MSFKLLHGSVVQWQGGENINVGNLALVCATHNFWYKVTYYFQVENECKMGRSGGARARKLHHPACNSHLLGREVKGGKLEVTR